jgi:hypothetical protein
MMSSNSNITNNNLQEAYNIIRKHKAFKEVFDNSPPQTKVFIAFIFPLFIGVPIYSFLSTSPNTQLIVFSTISLLIGLFFYKKTNNYSESWAVVLAFLVGTFFWLYLFINNYRKMQNEKNVGKNSFICNPSGVCNSDGIKGPYDGTKKYIYNPQSTPSESNDYFIPHNQFDIRNSTQFTYMFWLKIDYNNWRPVSKSNQGKFYGRDKIILMKGASIDTSDLIVWGMPTEDAIQFDIKTGGSSTAVTLSVNFPFDQWVHYTIIVNSKVAELYKNATLEKSVVLKEPVTLKQTPLYLGSDPEHKYDKFPGQLLFLTYNNSNLTPGEIYKIYNDEYSKIISMDISENTIKKPAMESCANSCDDNTIQITEFNSMFQVENSLDYQKDVSILSPGDKIKKDGLIAKYKNLLI